MSQLQCFPSMALGRLILRANPLPLPTCSGPFYTSSKVIFLIVNSTSFIFSRNKISSANCASLGTGVDYTTGLSTPKLVPQSTVLKMIEEIYGEINVDTKQGEGVAVRLRQHTNPLKQSLMGPYYPPVWAMVFTNPKLPLNVDIGSGNGRFLMLQAKRNAGSSNFLGLDVRDKLVKRSNIWAQQLQLKNIHFITANATIALDPFLAMYPGKLNFVSILCPDPHFKRRLYKRRIVQRPLVDAIVKYLTVGGKLFLQSDVKEVVLDMKRHFKAHLGSSLFLVKKDEHLEDEEWYPENPTGIPTEREVSVVARGLPMFRLLYERG